MKFRTLASAESARYDPKVVHIIGVRTEAALGECATFFITLAYQANNSVTIETKVIEIDFTFDCDAPKDTSFSGLRTDASVFCTAPFVAFPLHSTERCLTKQRLAERTGR